MPWFCVTFPWCTPEVFRALEIRDYYRLKPIVDEHRRQATAARR